VTSTRPATFEELRRRRWQLLALTSVGAFMAPLDGAIVAVALPVMSPDLGLSFSASMWVQAVYLVATAVLLIPLGRLADQRGRVRFYLIGIVVFTAGSLLCALSTGGVWLIASRGIQGVGSALLGATAVAIVTAVFPPEERGRALGINVSAVYLGLSVGPPLGGFLTDAFGWEAIFLVNVPVGIVVFAWGWLLLPRDERAGVGAGAAPGAGSKAPPRPDLAGTALWAVFLVCLLVPLTFASRWGWDAPSTLVMLAVSGVALLGFIVVESRVADPLLDLDLLRRNRLFAAANSAALLNYMAMYAVSLLTSVFLEVTQDRSATLTGWIMLSQPVMQATLAPLAGRLSDRIGSRVLSTAGMLLTAAGMVLLGTMPSDAGLPRVMVSLAVVGVGLAAFSAPNTSAVMGSVERGQLSLAGAFLGTMRSTGMALSVAILGGIAASQLGRTGGQLIFGRGDGGALGAAVAADYARGYRYAMLTGAALAVLGALISLTRGAHDPVHTATAAGPAGPDRAAA
jgi:EmrB/QacA subfamily drug resistance transporter